jgi:hypothetical protein
MRLGSRTRTPLPRLPYPRRWLPSDPKLPPKVIGSPQTRSEQRELPAIAEAVGDRLAAHLPREPQVAVTRIRDRRKLPGYGPLTGRAAADPSSRNDRPAPPHAALGHRPGDLRQVAGPQREPAIGQRPTLPVAPPGIPLDAQRPEQIPRRNGGQFLALPGPGWATAARRRRRCRTIPTTLPAPAACRAPVPPGPAIRSPPSSRCQAADRCGPAGSVRASGSPMAYRSREGGSFRYVQGTRDRRCAGSRCGEDVMAGCPRGCPEVDLDSAQAGTNQKRLSRT